MKLSSIRKGVLFVVATATLGLGCELIVDFDRTKIPVEGNDAAIVTDASLDAPIDTSVADTSTNDADAADAAETSVQDSGTEADAPDSG
jgi:hypothetical protein